MSSRSSSLASVQAKYWTLLFAGLTSALFLLYKYAFRPGVPDPRSTKLLKDLAHPKKLDDEEELEDSKSAGTTKQENATPLHSNKKINSSTNQSSGSVSVSSESIEEESEDTISLLHSQIEQIDKRGKALFKQKNYVEAAEVFTEAVDLIHSKVKDVKKHGNLNRQVVTLMNNRSAMYEKGGMPELALHGKSIVS